MHGTGHYGYIGAVVGSRLRPLSPPEIPYGVLWIRWAGWSCRAVGAPPSRRSTTMEDLMRSTPETDRLVDPSVDQSGDPAAPTTGPRYDNALAPWPRRRRVAVAVAAPVLFGLMVTVSGGWAPPTSAGWTALVALAALSCATILATYLPHPGTGLRIDVGCTPCAAVAALTVLAACGLLSSAPHDVSTAVLALGVSGFGLVQRLKNPSTCPA